MKGDDNSKRLLDFAVRVIRLVMALPKSVVGRHVSGQLVRAGTSAGANYEEARGGQSRPDFIHKLAIAWRETRESCYWLRLIQRAQLIKPTRLDRLLNEGVAAILGKSLATASKKPIDNS